MKKAAIGICVMSVLSGVALAAQLYRWVDEKGNVEYRDTPPPTSAKKVEQRRIGGTVATTTPSFSMQQAMKSHPVTLWTANCGVPCDQAKAHLARRGVPYTEKDAQADVEAFQKLTGGSEVPVLYVGATRLKGYLDTQWDGELDAAGYPRTVIPGSKPAVKTAPAAAPKPEPQAAGDTAAPPAAK